MEHSKFNFLNNDKASFNFEAFCWCYYSFFCFIHFKSASSFLIVHPNFSKAQPTGFFSTSFLDMFQSIVIISTVLLLGPSFVLQNPINQTKFSPITDGALQSKSTFTTSSPSHYISITPKQTLAVKVFAIVVAFWLFNFALSILFLEFSDKALSKCTSIVAALFLFSGSISIVVVVALHLPDIKEIQVVVAVIVIPFTLAVLVALYLLCTIFLFKLNRKTKKEPLKMPPRLMKNPSSTVSTPMKGAVTGASFSKCKLSPWAKKFSATPFSKKFIKA